MTVYAPSPQNCTVDVNLVYIEQVIGAESYRSIVPVLFAFGAPIASTATGTGNFNKIEAKLVGGRLYYYLYNFRQKILKI